MNLLQHCGWCPGRTSTVGQSFASQFQTNNLVAYSKPNPDFPISSFLGERNPPKKKRILCRENITCLPMFVLVGGSTPFKPWKVQDQGSNLPVKFPFLVKSIILVAEFPYVCFYQTIFCQLNPMFFLSEIPFCWVKPCDAPRNPKVDLHSTSAASSHRRSPKSNEFPSC